jgi:ribosomal protein S18 acetylase RimI-like enzyme
MFWELSVANAYQNRALVSFAEEEAARCGLTRMTLVTHEVMTENQAIYARLGYTEVERRTTDGYRAHLHGERRQRPYCGPLLRAKGWPTLAPPRPRPAPATRLDDGRGVVS